MQEDYRAGIYARLSVDSSKEKNSSIDAQIALAKAFIRTQPDICLYQCYTDLGKTGRNFQREGFLQLMAQVQQGTINCIIVKDFSRLGRDYLETGNYIQNIFPLLKVRFIALDEQYDSLQTNVQPSDMLAANLKNLANEMYARDIAAKVKSTKRLQKEQGSYMGSIPPYGCAIKWCGNQRCLFAEAVTSDIVKELFVRYGAGCSLQELVVWLYESRIHRPKDYRRYGHAYCIGGEKLFEWPKSTLRSLLLNPVYSSCPANGCPHISLITEQQFFQAAGRFKKAEQAVVSQNITRPIPAQPDLFAGILYCGCCHGKLGQTYHMKSSTSCGRQKQYGYYCLNSTKIDARFCERKYIAASTLAKIVRAVLRLAFTFGKQQPGYFLQMFQQEIQKQEKNTVRIAALQKEMDRKRRQVGEWYLKYKEGEMTGQEFSAKKELQEAAVIQLKEQQKALLVQMEKVKQVQKLHQDHLRRFFENGKNSQQIIGMPRKFIEKIVVFPGQRLTITFCFKRNFTFPVDKNM